MFTADQTDLDIGFAAAQARLLNLVDGGRLTALSRHSYEGGLEHLLRVGPPGVSKLVRVSFTEPVSRGAEGGEEDAKLAFGLRWEATGMAGGLFPVLDADLTLTSTGAQATRLVLVGSYRPPLGGLGTGLDRAVLHQVAAGTIRALLRDVGGALVNPSAAVGRRPGFDIGRESAGRAVGRRAGRGWCGG
jgi:hypothetical protein